MYECGNQRVGKRKLQDLKAFIKKSLDNYSNADVNDDDVGSSSDINDNRENRTQFVKQKQASNILGPQNHIETLYTAQDHLWINRYFLPFIRKDRYTIIPERNTAIVDRFSANTLQKYGLPCKMVTVTGNGGTGKSYTSIAIAGVCSRSVFMASTGMGGNVIHGYLSKHISPFVPQCYRTVFKFFGINVDDYHRFMEHVFGDSNNYPEHVYTGDSETLNDFWSHTAEKWLNICYEMQANRTPTMNGGSCKKASLSRWISPQDYAKHKETLSPPEPWDKRTTHERTLEKLLNVYSKNKIPDMLLYDTFVVDEACRESPFFTFLLIINYYFLHQTFDTDEVDRMPTICLLGSINQSMTMNSGLGSKGILYGILEHDMISVTTKKMFPKKECLRQFKQYNRRIGETNNPKYKALVMEFNSMLENNDPNAHSLLKEIKEFSSVPYEDFFFVANEKECDDDDDDKTEKNDDEYEWIRKENGQVIRMKKDDIVTDGKDISYLRICDIHADNMTVEDNFQKYYKKYRKADILEVIESVYGERGAFKPDAIFNANSNFCPAFEDVKYNFPNWNFVGSSEDRTPIPDSVYQALFLLGPATNGTPSCTVDKYSSTRNIYSGMSYIVTHNCRCQVISFTGLLNDFMDDYNAICGYIDVDAHFLCASILTVVGGLLGYLLSCVNESMEELMKECKREMGPNDSANIRENRDAIEFDDCSNRDDGVDSGYRQHKLIAKHLINIQQEVSDTRRNINETGNASNIETLNMLRGTFNECCAYANMYKFADLTVNYDVKYEYGWIFVRLQKLIRLTVTGFEVVKNGENHRLNIQMGKTFTLKMSRVNIRISKSIVKYPLTQLMCKKKGAGSDSRYYKNKGLKQKRQKNNVSGINKIIVSTGNDSSHAMADIDTTENDHQFIFDVHEAEEQMRAKAFNTQTTVMEDFEETMLCAPPEKITDIEKNITTEIKTETNPTSKKKENRVVGGEDHQGLTVVEIFPIKPALTSTVASLQGAEIDTPHCLFVKKNSDSHNLIVGTSRAKNNIENLRFCFEGNIDDITIQPLSDTKVFVQKTILSQVKGGLLD